MRGPLRLSARPGPLALGALLAAALATGCGDARTPAGAEVTIDTLATGEIQVTSPLQGQWAEGEGWQLDEELRIGSATSEGPDLFGSIAALAVDTEGRILVLDSQARELRFFAPDGTHLRTVGGEGGGPGEFASPVGLALDPIDGTIWVVDPGNGRYTLFTPEGDLLTTHPRPIGYFALPWPTGFTDTGAFYDVVPGGLVRLTDEAAAADTLRLPEDDSPRVRIAAADGGMLMTMVPPFGPRLHWRFDRTGHLWESTSDRFHFVRRTLDGERNRIVRRDHEPVAVTRAEADSIREVMEEQIGASGAGANPEVEGSLDAPPHKPAFSTFLVDDRGGLWVEPHRAADDPERRLAIFDPEGVHLGEVEVDPGLQLVLVLPVFRDEHLYAVVTDDLDIPSVVRYRIRGR